MIVVRKIVPFLAIIAEQLCTNSYARDTSRTASIVQTLQYCFILAYFYNQPILMNIRIQKHFSPLQIGGFLEIKFVVWLPLKRSPPSVARSSSGPDRSETFQQITGGGMLGGVSNSGGKHLLLCIWSVTRVAVPPPRNEKIQRCKGEFVRCQCFCKCVPYSILFILKSYDNFVPDQHCYCQYFRSSAIQRYQAQH